MAGQGFQWLVKSFSGWSNEPSKEETHLLPPKGGGEEGKEFQE